MRRILLFSGLFLGLGAVLAAFGIGVIGGGSAALAAQPEPWQWTFQPAATPVMENVTQFNNFLLYVVTIITLFVFGLMGYTMWRFRASANPTPSKTSHNTLIEVVWTIIPIVILVVIAVPSFRLLSHVRAIPEAGITVKAVGYQWYWGYEYPDHGDFAFDSLMLEDGERGAQPRLLATDTALVVPVDTNVRLLVTAADVIHSWAMPSFGVKMDAVPGKINEVWFRVNKTGTYYGQCSELCGIRHAFMPIRVEVVSQKKFKAWLKEAQREYGAAFPHTIKLANIETK